MAQEIEGKVTAAMKNKDVSSFGEDSSEAKE
jgi:hypothetical protein